MFKILEENDSVVSIWHTMYESKFMARQAIINELNNILNQEFAIIDSDACEQEKTILFKELELNDTVTYNWLTLSIFEVK